MYEARGLIEPKRSPKGTRLYSHKDVDRLRRIQEMTAELGMNLAGVERVFELEEQLEPMSRKVAALEKRAASWGPRWSAWRSCGGSSAPRSCPTCAAASSCVTVISGASICGAPPAVRPAIPSQSVLTGEQPRRSVQRSSPGSEDPGVVKEEQHESWLSTPGIEREPLRR